MAQRIWSLLKRKGNTRPSSFSNINHKKWPLNAAKKKERPDKEPTAFKQEKT